MGKSSEVEFVRAQPEKVSARDHIDRLANLYSHFINGELTKPSHCVFSSISTTSICLFFPENLVPNFTVEVYFLLQLLSSRTTTDCDKPVDLKTGKELPHFFTDC